MAWPELLSARGNREPDLRGIPPGMFPETECDSETVQLERGDSVIFLSDGFCLAQNPEGEFFGMESVLEVCENSRENSPEEILQQLTEVVVSYSCGRPQQDDRTAAILRYMPRQVEVMTSAEITGGKRSGEFKLTVRRRSSNKDSNGNQPRRVRDEDDEVPTRLCTGVLLVRTAVQSK
jgi:hypothetical protein